MQLVSEQKGASTHHVFTKNELKQILFIIFQENTAQMLGNVPWVVLLIQNRGK